MRKILLSLVFVMALTGLAYSSLTDIETAILQEDYTQAKSLAEEMIKQGDNDPQSLQEIRYYLGLSTLRLMNLETAKGIFQDLLKAKVQPKLVDKIQLALFEAYYLQDNYPKAEKIMEDLLRSNPDSSYRSLIYLKLARAQLKMAQWKKAQVFLNKIIEKFPQSLEAHLAKQLLDEKQFFAVQVGSFTERARAEQLMQELKGKDEYAYIVETMDPNHKTFYRVRVGELGKLKEAQNLKSKLAKLGYPTRIYP